MPGGGRRGPVGGGIVSGVLSSVFYFVIALGLLITFHEYGHYWMARRMGVKVLRFSIGFGKPLWSVRKGPDQTEYALAAIPLGGYVRMLDEREGEVAPQERHRAFNNQSLGARAAIVTAGPLANFLFAIVAYWLIFVLGVTGLKPVVGEVAPGSPAEAAGFEYGETIVAVGDEPTPTWRHVALAIINSTLDQHAVAVTVESVTGQQRLRRLDISSVAAQLERGNLMELIGFTPAEPKLPPVIGTVEAGGAAAAAGLRPGDRILSVDGQPVEDWEAWVIYVRAHPAATMMVTLRRAGSEVELPLTPATRHDEDGGDYGFIGAGVEVSEAFVQRWQTELKYPPTTALGAALQKTWDISVLTVRMLWGMVAGQVSMSNISGPISIAKYAGSSADAGLVSFLTFLAVVSISLGVLNLLPIPVLDGGHLLFFAIEFIKGSPLTEAAQAAGQQLGMVLLMMLMVVAFYNDIVGIFA